MTTQNNRKFDSARAVGTLARAFSNKWSTKVEFGDGSYTDGESITIKDPDALMAMGLTEDEADAIVLPSTAHEAAHLRFSTSIPLFERWIKDKVALGAHKDLVFACLNFAEDMRIDQRMIEERPGYLDLRNREVSILATKLYKPGRNQFNNLLTVAIAKSVSVDLTDEQYPYHEEWAAAVDEPVRLDKAVKLFQKATEAKSTEEALQLGWRAYLQLFGTTKDLPESKEEDGKERGKKPSIKGLTGSGSGKRSKDSKDSKDSEGEEGEFDAAPRGDAGPETLKDSEIAAKVISGSSYVKGVDEDTLHKMADVIKAKKEKEAKTRTEIIDKISSPPTTHKRDNIEHLPISVEIERLYSKNEDAGCLLWWTKPSVIDKWAKLFRHGRSLDVLNTQAAVLGRKLKDLLRQSAEYDKRRVDSGRLVPRSVWRAEALGDPRVFSKRIKNTTGGYAIMLLLDASASMYGNDSKAREAAYIFTKATMIAGLSIRVDAYDAVNSGPVVHHELIPWGSKDATRVLAYHAIEANRDWFSIKAATHILSLRPEEHKILIVFNDGIPCHDGVNPEIFAAGGISGGFGRKQNEATAKAVRLARQKNIKVLGVHFGKGRDLSTEKLIFGDDLVWIKSLSRFVPEVTKYLEKLISRQVP